MSKRISATLIFTMAVAVVALFAATQVMAQDPVSCTTDSGGYTISIVPDQDGRWPIPYNGGWLYRYGITGNLSKITHTAFGIPYISASESIDVSGELIHSYRQPGEGSAFSDFGVYIFTARVVDLSLANPVPGTEGQRTEFVANTSKVGTIGGSIITAKGVHGCVDGVPGPVPENLDPVPEVLKFTREADGYTCEITITLEPFFIEAHDPFDEDNDAKCRETQETPIENLVVSGGTALELQEGWFAWHGSPAEYCYYNKKKRKYVCVTY